MKWSARRASAVYQPPVIGLMCGLTGAIPNVMNPNLTSNVATSIVNRLARQRPKNVKKNHWREHVRIALSYLLDGWYVDGDYETLYQLWRDENNYSETRKRQLDIIKEDLVNNWDLRLTQLLGRKWNKMAFCKSFGKREFLPKDGKTLRSINSRTDLIKVLIGPYVHAMEKHMYDPKTNLGRFFFKHVKQEDQFDLIDSFNQDGCVVLETDHTNFEGSISAENQLTCEHQFYAKALVKQDPRILAVFRRLACEDVKCHFRNSTLSMHSIRMSGEMYTSLGNGLTNLMSMHYVIDSLKSTPWPLFKCLVEGDDGLTSVSRSIDTSQIETGFNELGFEVKMIVHPDATTASFCGRTFNTKTRTIMTDPTYVAFTSGYSFSSTALNKKNLPMLTALKGFSLRSQYPKCPIVWAVAARMIRTGGQDVPALQRFMARYPGAHDVRQTEILNSALKDCTMFAQPDMASRALFDEIYHIPIDVQLRVEKQLNDGVGWCDVPLMSEFTPESWQRNFGDLAPYYDEAFSNPSATITVRPELAVVTIENERFVVNPTVSDICDVFKNLPL
jgi:hypothetical protein